MPFQRRGPHMNWSVRFAYVAAAPCLWAIGVSAQTPSLPTDRSANATRTPCSIVRVDRGEESCIVAGSGKAFKDCFGCPEMVVVPAGQYTMGSAKTESGRDSLLGESQVS